jgi:hypothetical protein
MKRDTGSMPWNARTRRPLHQPCLAESGGRRLDRARLVEDGDRIEIDFPNRGIKLAVSDTVLAERRKAMEARGIAACKPASRKRNVSPALKTHAAFTTSAARGAGCGAAGNQQAKLANGYCGLIEHHSGVVRSTLSVGFMVN